MEKIRIVVSDGHELEIGAPQLVALPVVEDEALGLVLLQDSFELKCCSVVVAGLDFRGYLVNVYSFQCFASGFDKIEDGLAAIAEALDFLGVTIGGLTINSC